MGEYQIIAMAAGMFLSLVSKILLTSCWWLSFCTMSTN